MSALNPPIPMEINAIGNALGDLAANGAEYVRLGALKAMASLLNRFNGPIPAPLNLEDEQRHRDMLDEVERIFLESKEAEEARKSEESDEEEESESANEEDEPP